MTTAEQATVPHEIRTHDGPRTVHAESPAPGLYLYPNPADVDRGAPCRWRIGHHSGRLVAAFPTRDTALRGADAIADWTDWALSDDILRARVTGPGRDQAATDRLLALIEQADGHIDSCAAHGPHSH
ncbi:hypothetical protein ACFVUN_34620 [Kitasatospora griseola]|uniref:hypothetical protein n=1 Tax=Kitasatospora griseola TaxID=2064 RepID=UPI0036D9021F